METPVKNQLQYHQTRFVFDSRRELVWKALCKYYFNKLIEPDFHVLDLGAGYGHFINNVSCRRRTAVDSWPLLREYVHPPVEAFVGNITDLGFLRDESVDFIFASNVLEHLTQADCMVTLAEARRILKRGGTLNVLQPNYRRAYKEYFDDYTHVAVYSDVSLCDFLAANGFEVIEAQPGFLPFSLKSRLPVHPALIRLYLALPWKPAAKQMLIRARLNES
jgi:SAM-dependent methyltransferase